MSALVLVLIIAAVTAAGIGGAALITAFIGAGEVGRYWRDRNA